MKSFSVLALIITFAPFNKSADSSRPEMKKTPQEKMDHYYRNGFTFGQIMQFAYKDIADSSGSYESELAIQKQLEEIQDIARQRHQESATQMATQMAQKQDKLKSYQDADDRFRTSGFTFEDLIEEHSEKDIIGLQVTIDVRAEDIYEITRVSSTEKQKAKLQLKRIGESGEHLATVNYTIDTAYDDEFKEFKAKFIAGEKRINVAFNAFSESSLKIKQERIKQVQDEKYPNGFTFEQIMAIGPITSGLQIEIKNDEQSEGKIYEIMYVENYKTDPKIHTDLHHGHLQCGQIVEDGHGGYNLVNASFFNIDTKETKQKNITEEFKVTFIEDHDRKVTF